MNNKHLLETSQFFTFEEYINYEDINFELYYDDYGMSYFLAWVDPISGETKEWSCGMGNDYKYDLIDIAMSIKKQKGEK